MSPVQVPYSAARAVFVFGAVSSRTVQLAMRPRAGVLTIDGMRVMLRALQVEAEPRDVADLARAFGCSGQQFTFKEAVTIAAARFPHAVRRFPLQALTPRCFRQLVALFGRQDKRGSGTTLAASRARARRH